LHTRSKRDWSSDVCSSDLDGYSRRPPESIRGPYPNRTQDTGSLGQEHRRGLARRRFCTTGGRLAPRDRLGGSAPKTDRGPALSQDRKSTRLNSSHVSISYA